jgi:hypothetical protein
MANSSQCFSRAKGEGNVIRVAYCTNKEIISMATDPKLVRRLLR